MGQSKKKMKNKRKADNRVGAKAKEKAKKHRQIEAKKEIKASKRKASEITGKEKSRTSTLSELDGEVSAVDKLFAGMGEEEEEEDGAGEVSDGEESSAGAFHDVGDGDDDDDGLDDDDEGLEDEDAGAQHEKELKLIKEKDPEFYKFLVENDRALLKFQKPAAEVGPREAGPAEDAKPDEADPQESDKVQPRKVLTMDRLRTIHESASTSFTAFKAAMTAYHTAVRSIEGQNKEAPGKGDDDDDDTAPTNKGKKAAKKKRQQSGLLHIDDEEIFSAVIEWSITNMLGLFRHFAGEQQMGPAAVGKGKKNKKPRRDSTAGKSDLLDPTLCVRWARVKIMVKIYWDETIFLLNHLVAPQMIEFVLRGCSTPDALVWLWPFQAARNRYFKRCCELWSSSASQNVRLLAFLFARNSAAMALQRPDKYESKVPPLEAMTRSLLRAFANSAEKGYTWRSLNAFRFMENCIVELLKLDDSTAYRIGYSCVRQLALILRNACIAASSGHATQNQKRTKGQKQVGNENRKKRRAVAIQQISTLDGWSFTRSIYLWTKAIGSVPALRPLAYPLSMVTMGALKHRLTTLKYFPFVYHCLLCMNKLSAMMEVFVPVSSHILRGMSVLLQAMEKLHKHSAKGKSVASSKAPDVEILLRFSETQATEILALEAMGSSLCFLLTDHLGLLSRSPAFPEISVPVLVHIRRYSKHCCSEPLRRQLKSLVSSMEATAQDVRNRREALTEVPSFKKLLIFEADTVLAKARASALERKVVEEKARVEAETQQEHKAEANPKLEGKAEKKKRKKKQQEKENDEPEAATNKQAGYEKALKKYGSKKADEDQVEEMGFSSGEDE